MNKILPAPSIENEFTDHIHNHNVLCGQCCEAAKLRAVGVQVSADDIDLTLEQHWNVNGGTEAFQLVWAGLYAGVPTYSVQKPLAETIDEALANNYYCTIFVGSDRNGHPVPYHRRSVGHWIVCYGKDDNYYYIANPGGGALEKYDHAYLEQCDGDSGEGIITARSAHMPEGILELFEELLSMGVFKNEDDAKNWFCVFRWEHYLMRGFEDPGGLPRLRTLLDEQGALGLEGFLLNSAEGTMRDIQKRVLLDSERGKQPVP